MDYTIFAALILIVFLKHQTDRGILSLDYCVQIHILCPGINCRHWFKMPKYSVKLKLHRGIVLRKNILIFGKLLISSPEPAFRLKDELIV